MPVSATRPPAVETLELTFDRDNRPIPFLVERDATGLVRLFDSRQPDREYLLRRLAPHETTLRYHPDGYWVHQAQDAFRGEWELR